jgi:hypothetical protein
MMEYPCPLYIQKLSLLREALSAAHFSVFRTLKNACARARARNCSRNSRPFFSPSIMSRGCGPLYSGSGFSLLRFFLRCYAPFWPR